jgi:hypothetical protein
MAKVCDMETSQANHTAMKPPTPACAPPRWLSGSHAAWSAPLTGRYDDPYQHDGWIGWILRDHWIAFVSALGDGLLFDIAQETPRDGSSRLYNPQHFYRRDLAQEITAAEVSAYNAMCKAIERYTGTPLTPEQACDRARVYDLAAAAIDAKAEHESHAALNEAVQAYVGQFKDYVSRTTVNNLAAGIIKGAVADRKERAANAGASVVDAVRAAQKATEKLPPKRDPHEVEISISVGTDNAELGQYVRNRLAVYANDVMADYDAMINAAVAGRGGLIVNGKKDIIVGRALATDSGKRAVWIYGWIRSDGTPVQPVYGGHSSVYVDGSHGVRLVSRTAYVNGVATPIEQLFANPTTAALLNEGGTLTPEMLVYPRA